MGIASECGRRRRNEDFAAGCLGTATQRMEQGVAAAIADGIGGAKGGREAAELAVRGFLDGYYAEPVTWSVQRAASTVVAALNRWIFAMGRADPTLAGMGCTFTALVLRGRTAHVLHVGDTRLYRLQGDRLALLSQDHALHRPELSHVLYRAIGIEDAVRLDYAAHPLGLHDRFLLCSDGVHAVLSDKRIAELLRHRSAPEETARDLVGAALAAGSEDNASALVLDVVALPPADQTSLGLAVLALPVAEMPRPGDRIDGFHLIRILSDGRYSRLFVAADEIEGGTVVIKFPQPRLADDATYKAAFVREAWVAARVRSPWLGSVVELAAGRQSRLYTVMPFYAGETLEQRLSRPPPLTLEEGRAIALKLCRAVDALHRAGVVHRDIKPDNILLVADGTLRLVDLGVARVAGLDESPAEAIPGTASYMAPELFTGRDGSEASDLFALGVTLFRAFTGLYPYGEIEPFSHPRFGRPASLLAARPDLPVWLEATLHRAIAGDPADRHQDVVDFMLELENGPVGTAHPAGRRQSLYDQNPLLVWQITALLLGLALLASLARH